MATFFPRLRRASRACPWATFFPRLRRASRACPWATFFPRLRRAHLVRRVLPAAEGQTILILTNEGQRMPNRPRLHRSFQFYDCNDKGKPVAKQGRKAVNLAVLNVGCEIVWLPKAN